MSCPAGTVRTASSTSRPLRSWTCGLCHRCWWSIWSVSPTAATWETNWTPSLTSHSGTHTHTQTEGKQFITGPDRCVFSRGSHILPTPAIHHPHAAQYIHNTHNGAQRCETHCAYNYTQCVIIHTCWDLFPYIILWLYCHSFGLLVVMCWGLMVIHCFVLDALLHFFFHAFFFFNWWKQVKFVLMVITVILFHTQL